MITMMIVTLQDTSKVMRLQPCLKAEAPLP